MSTSTCFLVYLVAPILSRPNFLDAHAPTNLTHPPPPPPARPTNPDELVLFSSGHQDWPKVVEAEESSLAESLFNLCLGAGLIFTKKVALAAKKAGAPKTRQVKISACSEPSRGPEGTTDVIVYPEVCSLPMFPRVWVLFFGSFCAIRCSLVHFILRHVGADIVSRLCWLSSRGFASWPRCTQLQSADLTSVR